MHKHIATAMLSTISNVRIVFGTKINSYRKSEIILATFLLLGESISVKTEQNCTDSITCTWILITVLNTDCEKILVYIIFKECLYNAYF